MTNSTENLWQVRLNSGQWFISFKQTNPTYNEERERYEFHAFGGVRKYSPKMDFATARNVRNLIGSMAEVVHIERD